MSASSDLSSSDENDIVDQEVIVDETINRCKSILCETEVPSQVNTGKKKRGRPRKNNGKPKSTTTNVLDFAGAPLPDNFLRLDNQHNVSSGPSKDLISNNNSSMENLLQSLVNELGFMRTAVTKLTDKITDALGKIGDLERENAELKEACKQKDEKILSLEMEKDEIDQNTRANCLIMSGEKVVNMKQNVPETLSKIFTQTLKLKPRNPVNFSYRMSGDGAKVLLTIDNYNDRAAIFTAVRKIKPNGLYINEFLTPRRQELLYELRKLKKEERIFSAFSSNGKIYYRLSNDSDRVLVKSMSDVRAI